MEAVYQPETYGLPRLHGIVNSTVPGVCVPNPTFALGNRDYFRSTTLRET